VFEQASHKHPPDFEMLFSLIFLMRIFEILGLHVCNVVVLQGRAEVVAAGHGDAPAPAATGGIERGAGGGGNR
jgi:hypothetical protein